MKSIIELGKRFISDEEGLETVEYAVMTALIVSAMVLAIGGLSGAVSGRFGATEGVINGIGAAPAPAP